MPVSFGGGLSFHFLIPLEEEKHLHWVDDLCGHFLGACDHLWQELCVVVVGTFKPRVGRRHAGDCEAGGERVLHLEEDGLWWWWRWWLWWL